jgi:hypothetical protein
MFAAYRLHPLLHILFDKKPKVFATYHGHWWGLLHLAQRIGGYLVGNWGKGLHLLRIGKGTRLQDGTQLLSLQAFCAAFK